MELKGNKGNVNHYKYMKVGQDKLHVTRNFFVSPKFDYRNYTLEKNQNLILAVKQLY